MKEDIWSWKPGFRGSAIAPADEVGPELERIKEENNGELLPEVLVGEGKPSNSILHGFFEWNGKKAAHEHRLSQARLLARSIKVERVKSTGGPEQAFRVTRSNYIPRKNVYRAVEDIMLDPEARAELLQRALSELLAARRKYHRLQELAIVFRELDKVLTELDA